MRFNSSKSLLNLGAIVFALLILTACSTTIPASYTPQTFLNLEAGETQIGEFRYVPADMGDVRSNQIKNSAVGSIFIATDVSNFVRRATALELERAGIQITDDAPTILDGDVLEFRAGDLGYSVQWTYNIRYRIRTASGALLFEREYTPPMVKTGKFGQAEDYAPNLNELVLAGIESFINDMKNNDYFMVETSP